MDEKSQVQSRGNEEELRRIRHENQCLRAEVERVRRERDDAETRFASSQAKVTELEHQVRKQSLAIADLKAEIRTRPEICMESGPPPPAAPEVPNVTSDFIEISDDEGGGPCELEKKRRSSGPSRSRPEEVDSGHNQPPQRERHFMDYVSIPRSKSRPGFHARPEKLSLQADPHDTERSSSSSSLGRFKRVRSASPHLEGSSSSTLVDDGHPINSLSPTLRSSVTEPPVKRPRQSKSEDVKGGLLRDVAEIYLQNIPAFPIEPLPNHEFYVSRKFLLDAFGASNQQFLANFKTIHIHNIDERRAAVFPQPTLNPFLPRTPGAAGLIFASRLEITIDRDPEPPWALFCRDNPSGAAVWRYMGDYRNRRCGSLTAEQFASQTPGVKTKWGKLLIKSQKLDVYVSMRARIALRKAGIAFVPGDAHEIQEMENVRKKRGIKLEPKDVVEALSRGDETIDIIKMECVAYDHEFVAEMGRRHDEWSSPAAVAARARGKLQRPAAKGKGKRVQKARRPRRGSDMETDSVSAFEPESEDEKSDDASAGVRPRRQKKSLPAPPQSPHNLSLDGELSDLTDLEE